MNSSITDWLGNLITSILNWVAVVLPDSPFKLLDYTPAAEIMPYVNYFIPVDVILDVMAAWLACISVYYTYSIILRWTKALG